MYFLLSTFVELFEFLQRALTSSLLPTLWLPILPLTSVALFKLILFFFVVVVRCLTMQSTKLYCVLLVTCCLSFSTLSLNTGLSNSFLHWWMFSGHALECYVCTNQEGNREKCLKSTKTCEQGQDACLTEIRWGSKFQLFRRWQYVSKQRLRLCLYKLTNKRRFVSIWVIRFNF